MVILKMGVIDKMVGDLGQYFSCGQNG